MRAITRLFFLNDQEEKFFGEGPYQLLKQIEVTGSLHAAAADIGMAYSKATKLIQNAEQSLGFSLTIRKIGGRSGGGSVLTEEAKDFLQRYEGYRDACLTSNKELYEVYFGNKEISTLHFGCVIMASGLGKRFGGDKLMIDLLGKPVLQYIVEATEDLFTKRIVVTRNESVKAWCEDRGIAVVYHDLPNRSDAVRLGIEALEAGDELSDITGCVFCQADMPLVTRESLQNMLEQASKKQAGIFRMAYRDKVGAPVLFGKDYFDALKQLPVGKGGNEIIKANPDKLNLVEVKREQELWDIDTKEDYEKICNELNIALNIK